MKIRRSYLWAGLLTIGLAGWLASGDLIIGGQGDVASQQSDGVSQSDRTASPTPPGSATTGPATSADEPGISSAARRNGSGAVRVRTAHFTASTHKAHLTLRGHSEANANVSISAQTGGLLVALPVRKGQRVSTGDVLCKLETGARHVRVLQARAALAQAELDFAAANELQGRGFAAQTRVKALQAALDGAKANLHEAELDLARTEIRAPFDGIIESEFVDVGDFIDLGRPCVKLLSLDPMLAVSAVSERDVARLQTGVKATVQLIGSDPIDAVLTYIATSADQNTRTFRIELELANADFTLRDGVSAEIKVPLPPVEAHHFSGAMLTLDDRGHIGVRGVSANSRVEFHPVEIVGYSEQGVWVSGLPDKVTLITVGQEMVTAGQHVISVDEKTLDRHNTSDLPDQHSITQYPSATETLPSEPTEGIQ